LYNYFPLITIQNENRLGLIEFKKERVILNPFESCIFKNNILILTKVLKWDLLLINVEKEV